MKPASHDLAIIGGGSAGYAAARTAVEHGLKTVVIDGAETLGGLCILRGCMPSKTLIESANRCRELRRASEFGLRAENTGADVAEIIARKRRLIGEFASYRQGQLQDGRFDLIRGRARFTDPHGLAVALREGGERRVEFAGAVIATGSAISRIPLPGLDETGFWTSDDILDAEALPDSFVVLGGGAIALEMACYLEGLGRRVTVIQRGPHLLTGTDPDVADALADALRRRENLALFTGTRLLRVEKDPDGQKTVHFEHEGVEKTATGHEILYALGRKPALEGLDLDAAGIHLAATGHIAVDSGMASTSQPHVFAAGDAAGPHEIVHIAIQQGEIAARNAARRLGAAERLGPPETIDYRLKILGVFTDPEVATAGIGEAEAIAAGRKVAAARYPFDDHGKSMVMGGTEGFVKLIADAENGELIGGAAVGPHAVDLIHEIVVALHFRCTPAQFLEIPHYHPTLSEIWTYPAEELLEISQL
ncbi:MAG: NAD(P)/FAD-dependent oxidoreductase [Akkermansiaceae bacterium]|nr:NAD(P)/FAD-dependent oxidoreductase [Akkermansiaceae bacterium]MCP5550091.1 NAD(P)/FAD-dependent oxidoreductase [Akkermansiaceae bacterium]